MIEMLAYLQKREQALTKQAERTNPNTAAFALARALSAREEVRAAIRELNLLMTKRETA